MKAVYDILISLVTAVATPLILLRALTIDRSYLGLLGIGRKLRRGSAWSKPIWIHASSVGEVKAALLLIDKLRGDRPDVPIVLTAFTPRGMSVARMEAINGVELRYCPLDFRPAVTMTIRDIDPAVLVLTETEIWLNLLTEAHRSRIPTAVVNGRLSKRNFSRYYAIRPLVAPLMGGFSYIHTQSPADAERFVALGARSDRVHSGENIKTQGVFNNSSKFDRAGTLAELKLSHDSKIIVCGSTRPGEERIILDAFVSARTQFPTAQLLIAPRHLDRLGEIENLAVEFRLTCSRKTALSSSADHTDVILLDTLGELWRMYGVGLCAFVGGSLVPLGGHNPLEPIALGVPTCFGPYMDNCSDLAARCVAHGFATTVGDTQQLRDHFVRCLGGQVAQPDRNRLRSILASDIDDIADVILRLWGRSNA